MRLDLSTLTDGGRGHRLEFKVGIGCVVSTLRLVTGEEREQQLPLPSSNAWRRTAQRRLEEWDPDTMTPWALVDSAGWKVGR